MKSLNQDEVRALIKLALEEDLPNGDVTCDSIGGLVHDARAEIVARERLVLCGTPVLKELIAIADSSVELKSEHDEGAVAEAGSVVFTLRGSLKELLRLERTMLNFLQHLSGIATHVRELVESFPEFTLLDTRKTLPGYRSLEKYSVRIGGGTNHRFSLSDQILIKDNHLDGSGKSAEEVVTLAKENRPDGVLVQIEVRSRDELKSTLQGRPDLILLDNMEIAELKKCIELIDEVSPEIVIEISGGINRESLSQFSATDKELFSRCRFSMGSLTYGAHHVDLAMNILS